MSITVKREKLEPVNTVGMLNIKDPEKQQKFLQKLNGAAG